MKKLKKFFKKEEVYYASMYFIVLIFVMLFTWQVWFNSDPEMNGTRWGIRVIFLLATILLLYQLKNVIKDLKYEFRRKELRKKEKIKLIDMMIKDLDQRKKLPNKLNGYAFLCHYVSNYLIHKNLIPEETHDLNEIVKKFFPEMHYALKEENRFYPNQGVVWSLSEFNYDIKLYYQAKIDFLEKLRKKILR